MLENSEFLTTVCLDKFFFLIFLFFFLKYRCVGTGTDVS